MIRTLASGIWIDAVCSRARGRRGCGASVSAWTIRRDGRRRTGERDHDRTTIIREREREPRDRTVIVRKGRDDDRPHDRDVIIDRR